MMRYVCGALVALILLLGTIPPVEVTATPLAIGTVQGRDAASPYVGRRIAVRGVVTGWRADRNSAGALFHTVFIQDGGDGDPATSDGLPLFFGTRHPGLALGDDVVATGTIIEYYGLTEMSHRGLSVRRVGEERPLPPPVSLVPGAPDHLLESLEGMRVRLEDVPVAGPTHDGCGFAVGRAPRVLPVLGAREAPCPAVPLVKVGDTLPELQGPLTYHFEQFNLVLEPRPVRSADGGSPWSVEPAPLEAPAPLPPSPPGTLRIATLNLENHFDALRDTPHDAEPVPDPAEVARRRAKYAALIGDMMGCPVLVAVQEVEKRVLLEELASEVAPVCGFTYRVLHRESADARGIDVALLVHPRIVAVRATTLSRACTAISTGILDDALRCGAGEEPLFSRPPLVARLEVEGKPLLVVVVHFKSKRGDPADTAARRLAQARHVRELIRQAPGHVLVLGDLNDTPDARPVRALTGDGGLVDLLAVLPPEEDYTYIYGGIPQRIDGFLADPALAGQVAAVRILHANAAFPSAWRLATGGPQRYLRATDHDVPVIDFWLRPPAPATVPATVEPAPTSVAVSKREATASTATVPPPAPLSTPAAAPSLPEAPAPPPGQSWWMAVVGLLTLGGALAYFYYRRT